MLIGRVPTVDTRVIVDMSMQLPRNGDVGSEITDTLASTLDGAWRKTEKGMFYVRFSSDDSLGLILAG